MNKILTGVLVNFLLVYWDASSAQSNMRFGLQIAPSIERKVWLGTMDWFKFYTRPSINVGGLFRVNLTTNFHLSYGLAVYDKGSFIRLTSLVPKYSSPVQSRNHFHSWYLSSPLVMAYNINLKERSVISPSIGIIYGRVIWKYTIKRYGNIRVYHNRYYDSDNENFWGLSIGFGLEYKIGKEESILIKPNFIRQLNRGWDLNAEKTNMGRFDSYVVDIIIFYNWDKIFKRESKSERRNTLMGSISI